MTYPNPPGAPYLPMAYPGPVALPPGFGALVVTVNRGPYLVPVPATTRFKVDGRHVAIPSEGTWHIPLPAGPHEVRYTDFLGIPMVTAPPQMIQVGMAQHLTYDFGVWRNRVRDAQNTDITKYGMWSNYTILLITLAAVLVFCCGGSALIGALSSGNGN